MTTSTIDHNSPSTSEQIRSGLYRFMCGEPGEKTETERVGILGTFNDAAVKGIGFACGAIIGLGLFTSGS